MGENVSILEKIYNPKETVSKDAREYFFDNLKFILIFLVVLGHFVEVSMDVSINAKLIWNFIYSFHMPLFVFISGYFAKNAIKSKNINRSIMFFVLYFIMKTVLYIIDRICGLYPNFNFNIVNSVPWYIFAMGSWYLISILLKDINKKYVFTFSLFLALIIGFDKNIGDIWGISRILVFYPFFLIGLNINRDLLIKIVKDKRVKCVSIIYLMIFSILFILVIDKLYVFKPVFTGNKSYFLLNNSIESFGVLIRMMWYLVATFTGISILSIVPRGKNLFTKIGQKTISIYFYHAIIFRILSKLDIDLRVYAAIILALIAVLVFSTKFFYSPLEKLLKLNLFSNKESNVKIKTNTIINIICILMVIASSCGVIFMLC